MTTKIQINSLAALERLIGGDNEFEMDIRKSVCAAFAEKHLKQIANDRVVLAKMEQVERDLRTMVSNAIEKSIANISEPKFYNDSRRYDMKPEIKAMFDAAVNSKVAELVTKVTADAVASISEDRLNAAIKKQLDYNIDHKIKEEVKKRIASIL